MINVRSGELYHGIEGLRKGKIKRPERRMIQNKTIKDNNTEV